MSMLINVFVCFQARRKVHLDVRGQLLPHVLEDERRLPRRQKDHEHHLKDQANRGAAARIRS